MGEPMRIAEDLPLPAPRPAPELVATPQPEAEIAAPPAPALSDRLQRLAAQAVALGRRTAAELRDPASYRADLSLDEAVPALGVLWRRLLLPVAGGWLVAAVALVVMTASLDAISQRKVEIAQLLTAMPPTVALKEEALTEDELGRVAATVRASHPGIEVRYKDGAIILRAPGMAMYGNWLAAIETAFNAIPHGDWAIEDLCIGEGCENAGQPTATLKGRRRRLVVSDLLAR